jgi:patatin-like phospholipase/acyl hydrolase
MQIDGGVICNNPALYAYHFAKNFHNHTNIRVVSIGTGDEPFTKIDPEKASIATFITNSAEFMMNIDAQAAHHYLQTFMPDAKNNYIRL